jgi:alanine racemase
VFVPPPRLTLTSLVAAIFEERKSDFLVRKKPCQVSLRNEGGQPSTSRLAPDENFTRLARYSGNPKKSACVLVVKVGPLLSLPLATNPLVLPKTCMLTPIPTSTAQAPTITSNDRDNVRVLKPRRAAPSDTVRPTRAEINLAALRHNAFVCKRYAGNSQVFAVLKADAYGHGAPAIARTLERAGVPGFAVALLEEAMELRTAGIQSPILVMGGYCGGAWEEVLNQRVIPVVYDPSQIEALAVAIRCRDHAPVPVHLKIDTGMARLGVRLQELGRVLSVFRRFPEVKLSGLMTHFACADTPDLEANKEQLALFDQATFVVKQAGFQLEVRHAANSAALLAGLGEGLSWVRPGVALYGVAPGPGMGQELRLAMKVRSEIVALRELAPGESAGYGWSWKASRPTRLATVPIGYADGVPRGLSNKGSMLVRGRRVPIAGAVSMDMVMVDVTDIPDVSLRDEVVVLGCQQGPLGKDCISVQELASLTDTIPWEILTNISRRVPRFYREP